MPLYEYECDANGHRFELIRKFSDPPVDQCPQCGSPVHKLFSSPAIQFKGSGFYITDYAKKDSSAEKADGGKGDGGKADGGKADGGKGKESGGTEKTDKTDTATKTDSATPAPAASSSDSSAKPAKTDSK